MTEGKRVEVLACRCSEALAEAVRAYAESRDMTPSKLMAYLLAREVARPTLPAPSIRTSAR